MLDPTREELIAFIESQYTRVTGETMHTKEESERDDHEGCGCRFEIECAAYYIASHYHGGQWSNLYSALSQSPYTPGMGESDLPDDLDSEDCERINDSELYLVTSAWIEGK